MEKNVHFEVCFVLTPIYYEDKDLGLFLVLFFDISVSKVDKQPMNFYEGINVKVKA